LLYSSLALPTFAIAVYIQASTFLSCAFILMQHIILIDWGYTLSSAWGRRERWWLVALLLLSLALIIASIAWGYPPSPAPAFSRPNMLTQPPPAPSIYDVVVYRSCRRPSFILLAVTAVTLVASVVVKHGSILTAGIVSVCAVQPPPRMFL